MKQEPLIMNKAVFIDKDGTLIPDIPYNVNTDLIEINQDTIDGIRLLRKNGFLIIVVSNQSGIAKGYFDEEALENVSIKISSILRKQELDIDAYYYCPHFPEGVIEEYSVWCDCRKPMPGMICKAAEEFNINLSRSWMIGDILNDVEAGNRAGCKSILINNGNETEWLMSELRRPYAWAMNVHEAASLILQSESYETA